MNVGLYNLILKRNIYSEIKVITSQKKNYIFKVKN